ncbi:alpha/beta hydrolase [Clostridium beijerinckii]|uniref:alpha/beta hydrolase n=1 Tax=Clostridium beijerinckii TaxID=1520 RepID=UPI00047B5C92|nr:alpha/beta hydrolase [Clostridium beijerinckii]
MNKLSYENEVADYSKRFKDFKMKSMQDNINLGITIYLPNGEIKGIFQISHGMMEHRKRYIKFMDYLGSNGYISVVHDHIGHGESVITKDDYGYFYDNGDKNLVEDLHQITLYMKQKYKDYPYFLFGFSMGSLIARAYLKKYDYELDGLILCGSPVQNKAMPCIKKLCRIIEKIKGDHYRSIFIHKIIRGIGDNVITTSEIERNKFMNDEGCGFIFTVNGFENLCNLIKTDYSQKSWVKRNLDLPILSIAGGDDIVIISNKRFNELTKFMKRIGYEKISTKIYADKYHDLLHEVNKLEVYKDILDWINSILGEKKT